MRFTIDEPNMGKYSLNAFYAGMHHRKRQQIADYWHALTRAALREAGIPRHEDAGPWEVFMRFNDRLDIDNHGAVAKMVIDGMKGWVWPDDSRRYIKTLTQEFYPGRGMEVEFRRVRSSGRSPDMAPR